jgi:hypothetical protein
MEEIRGVVVEDLVLRIGAGTQSPDMTPNGPVPIDPNGPVPADLLGDEA